MTNFNFNGKWKITCTVAAIIFAAGGLWVRVNGVCDRVNELERQKIDRGVYSAHLESIEKRLTSIEGKIDVLSGRPVKILSVDRTSH